MNMVLTSAIFEAFKVANLEVGIETFFWGGEYGNFFVGENSRSNVFPKPTLLRRLVETTLLYRLLTTFAYIIYLPIQTHCPSMAHKEICTEDGSQECVRLEVHLTNFALVVYGLCQFVHF